MTTQQTCHHPFLRVESLEERVVPVVTTIREATGPNIAAIQGVVDTFRNDLGGGAANANQVGSVGVGRREINWDAVPDTFASPNAFPGDFFNAAVTGKARGAVFTTPDGANNFQVSAKTGNPTTTPLRFGNLNASYETSFGVFSPERLFTSTNNNIIDVNFFIPGTKTPAVVTGFGAVFTDVDQAGSSKLEFFDAAGNSMFSRQVLATPGDGSLSFLGVTFDQGIARVRITAGEAALGANDVTQGGSKDLVVLDDFIYGEPNPIRAGVQMAFEATGAMTSDIQTTVDAFRAALGTANPNEPGTVGEGRRQIDWDAVPDTFAAPNAFPGDFFNGNVTGKARGVVFSTPGTGFQVSAKAVNPTTTPPEFGNIDATYPFSFDVFSSERLFTAIGSNVTEINFFVPGSTTPATVRGFGAVFTDVDTFGSSQIEFFDAQGQLLNVRNVLATPGSETLSFLGVTFTSAAIAKVRITSGDAAPGAGVLDVSEVGGTKDIVVMDDFIFGEPIPLTVNVPGAQTLLENKSLTLSNGTAVNVMAGKINTEVQLSANKGTLSLSQTTGLTFRIGDGTSDPILSFFGTPAAVNAALNGLVYTPNANFAGMDTVTVSGEQGFVVKTIGITVNAANVDQNEVSAIGAGIGSGGRNVRVFNSTGTELFSFLAFDPTFLGGVRPALGDVTGDNVPDAVVGNGPGNISTVQVVNGATQKTVTTLTGVYEPSFTGGIFVAVADLNGDGVAEIITTPDQGGGGRVRIFDGKNPNVNASLTDFLAIEDPNFRGGARVAIADINGDGIPDLVVGAGFGGGPRIAVFDGKTLLTPVGPGQLPPKLFGDFFAFEDTLRNGTFVAGGDLNADNKADLVFGAGPGGGPRVLAISGAFLIANNGLPNNNTTPAQLANFFGGDPNGRNGIRVAVKDLNGDPNADLVVGAAEGVAAQITTYLGNALPINGDPPVNSSFTAFDTGFKGGVFVG